MFAKLFRKRRSIGLDVGASSVKVVELSGKSTHLSLTALAAEPLAPDTLLDGQIIEREEAAQAIKKLFQDQRLRATSVTAGVGSYSVISKIIEVPLMAEQELSECIGWHAEEHIPYDIADVHLDYQILGSTEDSLQVLIVACKREVVANLKHVIKFAGERAHIIDTDALALQNCYTFNHQPADDSLVALVHVGASRMIINIVRGRRCEFTREIMLGGNHHTDEIRRALKLTFEQAEAAKVSGTHGHEIKGANIDDAVAGLSKLLTVEEQFKSLLETVLDLFELEIRRSLDFYRATSPHSESPIQKIMISGGGSNLKGLREILSAKFELPVEPLNPFRRIKCDASRFSQDFLNKLGPEMAIAVGLALRGFNAPALVAINLAESSVEPQLAGEPDVEETPRAYKFKGINSLGDVVIGERMANNRQSLRTILRREQIVLTSIIRDGGWPLHSVFKRKLKKAKPKVSDEALEKFTRQFQLMLWIGLPFVPSLDALAQAQKNKYFRRVLEEVCQDVDEGSLLSAAMSRHGDVFDDCYVNMIEAAEAGGLFDEMLLRVATYLERRVSLRRKISLALLYPATVLLIALTVFVPARVFANVWAFLTSIGGAIALVVVIAASLSLYAYFKTNRGRRQRDRLLLRIPFLGSLLTDYATARFARIFSMLLSSGVPIITSLDIAEKGMGNVVFREAVRKINLGVQYGLNFSDSMTEVFPEIVRMTVGAGEQMGCLDSTLGKIADQYEQEVDKAVSHLPFTLLLFGILLLALVIGLPLFIIS